MLTLRTRKRIQYVYTLYIYIYDMTSNQIVNFAIVLNRDFDHAKYVLY